MGYFSEFDLSRSDEYADWSYHGAEEQLLWRYEDLRERYRELTSTEAPFVGDDHFNAKDYLYAPIERFKTISDLYRAMEIAKEELWSRYGIIPRDDGSMGTDVEDEEDPNQITLFEIVLLPTWFQTAAAA